MLSIAAQTQSAENQTGHHFCVVSFELTSCQIHENGGAPLCVKFAISFTNARDGANELT